MDDITIKCEIPSVDAYRNLRRAVDWPTPVPEVVGSALKNVLCGFIVEKKSDIIGMATVIGDGFLFFYIQDVIIHPDHQRQGIGTNLMEAVMAYINSRAAPKAYIALFSAKGLEPFYKRYGFIERPTDRFGAGMFFIKGLDLENDFKRS